ncbi:glycosyltransferase [Verrucomicrobia bacterium]|nr:glycosyltransferase [Verrucomicrobiota bacterium]
MSSRTAISLIDAWKKAFPRKVKDVRLLVKMHPDDPDIDVGDPRIEVKKEFWSRKQLASWYAGLDCLVSASYGEGWGLHQHEAAATGRHVIAVPFGGISEWFDENIGHPVDYDLVPASDHYGNGGLWAKPRQASLIDRMREVYGSRRCEKALRASDRATRLSWDNSNRMLDKALSDAGFYT